MLEAAGVTPLEEEVYRALLRRSRASITELAGATGAPRARVRSALEALEEKGLATRSPSKTPRFSPTRPDIAIESLIHRRREELERVRQSATDLLAQFQRSAEQGVGPEVIELVHGQDAYVHRYLQMRSSTNDEWLALDKPPYVTPREHCENTGARQRRRGLHIRAIHDRVVLDRPGRLEQIRTAIAEGAKARMLKDVPLKLAIADRRYACLPLTLDHGEEAAIFVYPSPVLDALLALFEMLWQQAAPLDDPDLIAPGETADLSDVDRHLLSLLAAGLKDELIAKQLGVGGRTVSRKVATLMHKLGAETRFQAALQASRKGWL